MTIVLVLLLWGVGASTTRGAATNAVTLGAIAARTLHENGPATNVLVTGIGGGGVLGVIATSSDPSLLPHPTVAYASPAASATLTLRPAANAFGSATVTVTATNDKPSTATAAFVVTVEPINHPPTGTKLNALNVNEDCGPFRITNEVTQIHGNVTNVTLTFASSNLALIPLSNIVCSTQAVYSGATRVFTIAPATNANGRSLISVVYANPGGASTTNSFLVSVAPINDPPAFQLTNRLVVLGKNAPTATVEHFATGIDLGPADEAAQKPAFSLKPSSASAFKTLTIATNGTLIVQVATNVTGYFPVAVWLKDSGGKASGGKDSSPTNYFYVAITNVTPSATISLEVPSSIVLLEDASTNLTLKVASSERPNVHLTATVADPSLLEVATSGAGSSRTLTITAKPNQHGATTIAVRCDDAVTTLQRTIPVTVTAVNDPPVLSDLPAAVSVLEDAPGTDFDFSVADVEGDTIALTATVRDPALASVSLRGALPRPTLTLTPKPDANGSTKIDVVAQGGTTATTHTIALTVVPVNDPPYFELTTNTIGVNENSGRTQVAGFATRIRPARHATNEGTQRVSFLLSASSTNGLAFASPPALAADGTLSFELATNSCGRARITVVALDTGGTTNGGMNRFGDVLVAAVTLDRPGSNYTAAPFVAFSGGGGDGATASALLTAGAVLGCTVVEGGSGYTGAAAILSGGGGSGASLSVETDSEGKILSLTPTSPGSGYRSPPTLSFTGSGSGAVVVPRIGTLLSGLTLTSGGSNYLSAPTVTLVGGGGTGASATASLSSPVTFEIQALPVNNAPVLGKMANLTLLEDFGVTNVLIPVKDFDTVLDATMISAVSSKPDLVAVAGSLSIGNGIYVMLNSVPQANSLAESDGVPLGSAVVTVSVDDRSGGQTSQAFAVTVTPVNDAPTFTLASTSLTADKYLVPLSCSNLIASVTTGPTRDETARQTWKATATVSANDAKLFVRSPVIDANGTLTYTPGTQSGTAAVTVTVTDSGGKTRGGKDTSAPRTLSIRIPPNPFPSLAGTYNGLFADRGVAIDKSGFVSLLLDDGGAFSGYLLSEWESNRFSGRFNLAGASPPVILSNATPSLTLTDLLLDVDPEGGETIAGAVRCPSPAYSSTLTLVRSLVGTTTPLAEAAVGDFALVLPSQSDPAPTGHSYGRLSVRPNGWLTFNGSLADGTAVTQQIGLSKYAEWPLYLPAYGNGRSGMLLGWLTFTDRNPNSAIADALVQWTKLPMAGELRYPDGFSVSVAPRASAYDPWVGLWSVDAVVTLAGGNLRSPIVKPVAVAYDTVTVATPGPDHLTLAIDPVTGEVAGSFIDTDARRTNLIRGVVLQNARRARGYFLADDKSGSFDLAYGLNQHPESRVVDAGEEVAFSVVATSAQSPTYQWKKGASAVADGGPIAGAATASLSLTGVGAAQAGDYCVAVTTGDGPFTSATASLGVILSQPAASQARPVGGTATFGVVAAGPGLEYQWRKDGLNLSDGGNVSGGTSATLTLTSLTLADAGVYTVVVSVSGASKSSANATLTVTP